RTRHSSRMVTARATYATAFTGDWLGTPAIRARIATGTCRITTPRRAAYTSVSTVSPRYSTGYHFANSSTARRFAARNPDVVSVSLVRAMRDSTTENMAMAQRRGPRTR